MRTIDLVPAVRRQAGLGLPRPGRVRWLPRAITAGLVMVLAAGTAGGPVAAAIGGTAGPAAARFAEVESLLRQLIQLHLDLGDVHAHLFARMDLVQQRHRVGGCADAVRQATAARQEWTRRHDPGSSSSTTVTMQRFGVLAACGRLDEAGAVAADLHLPLPDEPGHDAVTGFLAALITVWYHRQPYCRCDLDQAPGVAPPRRPPATHAGATRPRPAAGATAEVPPDPQPFRRSTPAWPRPCA
ncbi:hypothetical protein [Dactylosporangium sp. CA-092794]|uniref:hypothetical protein n=1 Tax=Dactylosporangium sp. CA-092794 TaxID=3239929 RepID=UPI003D8BCAD1